MSETAEAGFQAQIKVCTGCLTAKPASEFHTHERHRCKACINAYHREYYRRNPRRQKAYYEAKKQDPRSWILNRIRMKAKASGVAFDLAYEDIFIPEHCPVLGIKLQPMGMGEDCASVDRLDPAKGYVRGNVSVISFRANRIKYNATAAELERIAAWMRAQGRGS